MWFPTPRSLVLRLMKMTSPKPRRYANTSPREDVPIFCLRVGLKCGRSDGFSGITANPLVGGGIWPLDFLRRILYTDRSTRNVRSRTFADEAVPHQRIV